MRHNPTINHRPIRIRINNSDRRLPLQRRILILLPVRLLPLPKYQILEQMCRGLATCIDTPVQPVCVAIDVRVAGLAGVEACFCHLVFGALDTVFEGPCRGGVTSGSAGYGALLGIC